jgi:hypothetical protein
MRGCPLLPYAKIDKIERAPLYPLAFEDQKHLPWKPKILFTGMMPCVPKLTIIHTAWCRLTQKLADHLFEKRAHSYI